MREGPTVAKHFRYGGIVVRVLLERTARGLPDVVRSIAPVFVRGRLVRADGTYPRATRSYAPLPTRYRRLIQADADRAEHEARKQRVAAAGVEVQEASRPHGTRWTRKLLEAKDCMVRAALGPA